MAKALFDHIYKDKVWHISFATGYFVVALLYMIKFFYAFVNYLIESNKVFPDKIALPNDLLLNFFIFIVMFIAFISVSWRHKKVDLEGDKFEITKIKGKVKK